MPPVFFIRFLILCTRPGLPAVMAAALAVAPVAVASDETGFRVPKGFEVSLHAGGSLAHDIFSMTIDAHGRVVVSGRGYVKILHDTNGDGRADKATLFQEGPDSGARGLYFDGNDLICVGDNGVRRIFDRDGDGVADGDSELWIRTERDFEHSANGIIKGPDGWFYLICGNDADIDSSHAVLPGSPVKNPVGGAVVRISPDGKSSDIYADGFRNPYALDFNSFGQIFTYEADGERDHYLPWYAPTRIFDIGQGMHHGWVLEGWQHSWSMPDQVFDTAERLFEVGRGSPTGVVVYRHHQFPERYHDGLFAVCWTYGRIYFFPLELSGSTYATEMETFMETVGDIGFAPTGIAVGPEGDLFVSIGGRGTMGSVFRVRYTGGCKAADPRGAGFQPAVSPISNRQTAQTFDPPSRAHDPRAGSTAIQQVGNLRYGLAPKQPSILQSKPSTGPAVAQMPEDPVREVLAAPQPLASWSRARWVPKATELGKSPFKEAATDSLLPLKERFRALEILVEVFGGLPLETARAVAGQANPELTARAVWAISRSPDSPESRTFLAQMTSQPDARMARAAWEALAALPPPPVTDPAPDWFRGLNHSDRRVRAATVLAGKGHSFFNPDAASWSEKRTPRERLGLLMVVGPGEPDAPWRQTYFNICLEVLAESDDASVRLDAVRLLQIGLGEFDVVQDRAGVYDGYVARGIETIDSELRSRMAHRLAPYFSGSPSVLEREMGRLFAMLEVDYPELLPRLAQGWTPDSTVESDIHLLIVASRIGGARSAGVTRRTASALAGLHHKMAAQNREPSRMWPARLGEVCAELVERDPALPNALIREPRFDLPDHALFARFFPRPEQVTAARKLLSKAEERGTDTWTAELIEFVTVLPEDESLPVLRRLWQEPRLQPPVLSALAENPCEEDRKRFVSGLGSFQPGMVERSATALARLNSSAAEMEVMAAIDALRRFCNQPREKATRAALASLLSHWSGKQFEIADRGNLRQAYAPWFDWFETTYPAAAAGEASATEFDLAEWRKRLSRVDTESGDAQRGGILFEERACARCHMGSWRLGPHLRGITSRFGFEDLFVGIVNPNRDVSPAYLPTVITTRSGAVYSGVLVYDAPTVKLLQIDPDTTVRLAGEEILEVRTGDSSPMPARLLDGLSDEDLADLYAFLRTLR